MTRNTEKEPKSTPVEGRRRFLRKLWWLLGGASLAEAAWIVVDFAGPKHTPERTEDPSKLLVAGPVDRFEPGTVTAFQQGKFYLSRLADGGFLALSRKCTHLGCTVPWSEEQSRFVCPCHASTFDLRGAVLSPPAPRPLDLFEVRIENNIVKVDVSAPVDRQAFAEDQVVHP